MYTSCWICKKDLVYEFDKCIDWGSHTTKNPVFCHCGAVYDVSYKFRSLGSCRYTSKYNNKYYFIIILNEMYGNNALITCHSTDLNIFKECITREQVSKHLINKDYLDNLIRLLVLL